MEIDNELSLLVTGVLFSAAGLSIALKLQKDKLKLSPFMFRITLVLIVLFIITILIFISYSLSLAVFLQGNSEYLSEISYQFSYLTAWIIHLVVPLYYLLSSVLSLLIMFTLIRIKWPWLIYVAALTTFTFVIATFFKVDWTQAYDFYLRHFVFLYEKYHLSNIK